MDLYENTPICFQDKDVKAMIELLRPMHEMLERGATTLKEQSFKQLYENELKEAWNSCLCYMRTKNIKEISQAWDLYYVVFRKISVSIRQVAPLDLNYVSPRLVQARDLELTVPGAYDPFGPLVTISSFNHTLQVISSKQRPRKVIIRGIINLKLFSYEIDYSSFKHNSVVWK
ncbi:unnamed protein product [Gongylonema pulchrum]|uniref:FRB_dom domain-containing protein n=1 Tax=Gongylonema pulchrum TaxID=637853 RepID=A0A183EUU2_9BILA|nr:unnamed protein product [Gongylonema pulchrum]